MSDAKINVQLAGERMDADVLRLLSRAEIRESDFDATMVALRFDLVQALDGTFRPIDDDSFTPIAQLALDVAAPGGLPVRLFDGYVTHVRPHFESIESNCYVEILATDASVLLSSEERVAEYPDASDSEAAAAVFERHGIRHVVEQTRAHYAADRSLLLQRSSDWHFVLSLARRNGFVCYLEPDERTGEVVAHFGKRAVEAEPQADVVILQEGANLRWVDLQFSMAGPVRHIGAGIDPIEKQLVRSNGDPVLAPLGGSLLGKTIEQGFNGAGAGAGAATALLVNAEPLHEAISAAGSGATDVDQFAIEARGGLDSELYRGLIRARRPLLLRGVGAAFSGTYYVRSVRTTLDEGALAQTFVAERNASGLRGDEEFGQSAEEVAPE